MAIRVGTGTTTKVIRVVGSNSIVKKVEVGVPVRRVSEAGTDIATLNDVNITNLVNGSLLVYKIATGKWTATKDIEDEQNINGGSY